MKNVKFIGCGLLVIGMLLVSMPTVAQQQQWQSTSTMQPSGSSLAPQVTAVGATSVGELGINTSSPAQAPNGPRRAFDTGGETGQSTESPIGDAMIPLMLMAVAFGGYITLRRKNLHLPV